MRSPLAVSTATFVLVVIGVLAVIVLALILVAPWKRVRDEPPLDKDVEARLLLHRPHPEEPTGEVPTTRVADLTDHLERAGGASDASASDAGADFAQLRDPEE